MSEDSAKDADPRNVPEPVRDQPDRRSRPDPSRRNIRMRRRQRIVAQWSPYALPKNAIMTTGTVHDDKEWRVELGPFDSKQAVQMSTEISKALLNPANLVVKSVKPGVKKLHTRGPRSQILNIRIIVSTDSTSDAANFVRNVLRSRFGVDPGPLPTLSYGFQLAQDDSPPKPHPQRNKVRRYELGRNAAAEGDVEGRER